jgi:AraC-like DNA-binding protein
VVYVAGPQTEPATHAIVAPTRLFGARLHPLAATRLIGPRLDRLTNGWEPLERFIGKTAVDLGKRMASVDVAEATSVFDSFFSEYLIGYVADRRLTAGVTAIFASQGCATVAELACAAATTERTLRRIFKQQVGLTPKCFARIVRLQAVIRRLETQPDWAQLAADFGYADQSHLIREMHALFGDTPSAIRGRRLAPK